MKVTPANSVFSKDIPKNLCRIHVELLKEQTP